MDVKFIFGFVFGMYAFADGHIIIYTEAGHESQDLDQTPLNTKAEMKKVKAHLAEISSKMVSFEDRVYRLEQSKVTEATTTTTEATQTPLIMRCPDGWLKLEESCYFFDSKQVYFPAAVNLCKEQEAHLVLLETKLENALLKSFLKNNSTGAVTLHWIGMTDSETEGVWKFTGTNITIPFTDWRPGEPENDDSKHRSGQDCAAFHTIDPYGWADINCIDRPARAVCEKNPDTVRLLN